MKTYKTNVSDEAGFCSVHLEDDCLSVSLIPELSAHIVPLRDKAVAHRLGVDPLASNSQ
jgi:hypothetical protein